MSRNHAKYFYPPADKKAREWGLYITTAGDGLVSPQDHYPVGKHPESYNFNWQRGRVLSEYGLIFITAGAGQFEGSFSGTVPVSQGDVIWLAPGEWHRYRPDPATGWHEHWICFKGDGIDHLHASGFVPARCQVISVGMNLELLRLFHSILETVQEQQIGFQQRAAAQTMHILSIIYSIIQTESIGGEEVAGFINTARLLMEDNVGEPLDTETIARSLNISYSRFRRDFKRVTGLSPNQYHLQLRIGRAKELLNNTTLSVGEIAYKLGYNSPFYFSKIFQQKTGMRPKIWRNRLLTESRK